MACPAAAAPTTLSGRSNAPMIAHGSPQKEVFNYVRPVLRNLLSTEPKSESVLSHGNACHHHLIYCVFKNRSTPLPEVLVGLVLVSCSLSSW